MGKVGGSETETVLDILLHLHTFAHGITSVAGIVGIATRSRDM